MSISLQDAPVTVNGGGVYAKLMSDVEEERQAAAPEETAWADLPTYRAYDRGFQKRTLTAHQERVLRGVLGNKHADNAVHKVVFAHAGRVKLKGWKAPVAAVQAFLDELWIKASLPKFSAQRNYSTIRDGNHAVGLAWEPASGRPLLVGERWWDGKKGAYVAYGANGLPLYAVREWRDADVWRRTLYYDDRIERYVNRTGAWEQYQLPADTAWPMPWVKRDGTPLHIPIVHLASGSDADTAYGASVLAGGALGLQDEINDVQRDITVAARMTAYQMYWATGVKARVDSTGEPISTEVGPGMFFENDSPDARYGVFSAGDMSQLIATHDMKIKTLANNTATPLHLITGGDWPSGDALVRADMPLAGSARDVVDSVQPSWATIAHRATELRNAFVSGAALDENGLITAEFEPTDQPDALTAQQIEHEKINTLMALKNLGFSTKAILMKYGLTEAEANTMVAEDLAETTAATEAQLPTVV